MISLTESAASKVGELSAVMGIQPVSVLCTGRRMLRFHLFLEFADAANMGDREPESHGVRLYVDPKSLPHGH